MSNTLGPYCIPQEIKPRIKINSFLFLADIAFIGIYFAIMAVFSQFVHPNISVLYHLYNIVVGLILVIPSVYNPQKKIYHTIYFAIKRDKTVYRPVTSENDNLVKSRFVPRWLKDKNSD